MTDSLTAAMLTDLRRPFTPAAVKYKPQTVTKDKTKALASFYIDARLAAERLNHVVGVDGWRDGYRVLVDSALMAKHHFPVECSLTVLGTTKVDVGIYQKDEPDVMAWKSAYSDALKRASVKFGVGAFLYSLPNVWAPVKTIGEGDRKKVVGFSDAGHQQLRQAYEKWLRSGQPFGEALDHGIVAEDDAEPHDDAAEPPPLPVDQPTDDEMRALIAKAQEHGFTREQISTQLENERAAHGCYRRSWWDEQMAFLTEAAA